MKLFVASPGWTPFLFLTTIFSSYYLGSMSPYDSTSANRQCTFLSGSHSRPKTITYIKHACHISQKLKVIRAQQEVKSVAAGKIAMDTGEVSMSENNRDGVNMDLQVGPPVLF